MQKKNTYEISVLENLFEILKTVSFINKRNKILCYPNVIFDVSIIKW